MMKALSKMAMLPRGLSIAGQAFWTSAKFPFTGGWAVILLCCWSCLS